MYHTNIYPHKNFITLCVFRNKNQNSQNNESSLSENNNTKISAKIFFEYLCGFLLSIVVCSRNLADNFFNRLNRAFLYVFRSIRRRRHFFTNKLLCTYVRCVGPFFIAIMSVVCKSFCLLRILSISKAMYWKTHPELRQIHNIWMCTQFFIFVFPSCYQTSVHESIVFRKYFFLLFRIYFFLRF